MESRTYIKTLEFCFGSGDGQEMELYEVQQLASVSDRFHPNHGGHIFARGGGDRSAVFGDLRGGADVERRVCGWTQPR